MSDPDRYFDPPDDPPLCFRCEVRRAADALHWTIELAMVRPGDNHIDAIEDALAPLFDRAGTVDCEEHE